MLAAAKTRAQPDPAAVQKVAVKGTLDAAIEMALGMKRGSIEFYQQLLAEMPNLREPLARIIAEGKTHVSGLMELAETVRQ